MSFFYSVAKKSEFMLIALFSCQDVKVFKSLQAFPVFFSIPLFPQVINRLFHNLLGLKRGEICRIPGSTVLPSPDTHSPTLIRLPHIQHEDFRQFITYVYTAKIILHDSKVFQIMNIAHDLGLTDLKTACEDHVIATMSVGNACTFLTSAMEIQEKIGGKCAESFVERCIAYIGEHASECVKSNGFLNLSREAILKIISSDFVSFV